MAFSPFLYAIAANPPDMFFHWNNDSRMAGLLLSRIMMGAPQLMTQISLYVILQKSSTIRDYEQFWYSIRIINNLGIAGGPVIAAITSTVLNTTDVRLQAAAPCLYFILSGIIVLIYLIIYFPDDIEPLTLSNRENDSESSSNKGSVNAEQMSRIQRMIVFSIGLLIPMSRAFIVFPLEANIVLFLETEFGWSTRTAGYATGFAFFLAIPFMVVFHKARGRGLSDMKITFYGSLVSIVMSFLIFPSEFDIMPEYQILFAGGILFAIMGVISSAGSALAISVAMEDSRIFSRDSMIFLAFATEGVGRLFSPFIGRYLVLRGSRTHFVYFLLAVCVSNLIMALYVMKVCPATSISQYRIQENQQGTMIIRNTRLTALNFHFCIINPFMGFPNMGQSSKNEHF